LTYSELLATTERLAGYLQKAINIKKGDRVLLCMQNSIHYVIAFYAILRANAVVVPLNPMNKAAELKQFAADSGATVVITTDAEFCNIHPLLHEGDLSHAVVGSYGDDVAV